MGVKLIMHLVFLMVLFNFIFFFKLKDAHKEHKTEPYNT
jgi:hypothetical protein